MITESFSSLNHVSIDSNPDLIICHITDRLQYIPSSSYFIIISGEPWDLGTKVDMAISPFRGQNTDTEIYYPFLYSSLFERHIHSMEIVPKKHFCAFLYYQSYPHRDRLFHLISTIQPVIPLGKACSNKPKPSTTRFINNDKDTYNDIAVRLYSSFRFVLAVENTWKEGYFTEKIINPIIANSVPLYWGHPSVFEYINKKRVIYIPEYTDESLLELVKNMTEEQYQLILSETWYTDKGKPDVIQKEITTSIHNIFRQ
jgi:hypothetical protein